MSGRITRIRGKYIAKCMAKNNTQWWLQQPSVWTWHRVSQAGQGRRVQVTPEPEKFARMNLFWCLHLETSSERLLRLSGPEDLIMWYFSVVHRLHFFEVFEYARARSLISQWIV